MGANMQRVRFSTAFENIQDLNPSFAVGKMRIAYVGDNRNGSSISREVLQDAIPSMFNCPVVAHYDRGSNSFGSHDIELVLEDNKIKIVNVTQPVGVVPVGAEYSFETDVDANGVMHEYLTTNVILWKRQEAFDHILEVGTIDESMECVFSESHIDDRGVLVADKMYFEAFCLLESAAPCYEGAHVELCAANDAATFKQQYAQMMTELAKYAEPSSGSDEHRQEGGKAMILNDNAVNEILAEFELTLDELDFEISEDMTVEEFRDKVSGFAAEKHAQEDSDPPAAEETQDEPDDAEGAESEDEAEGNEGGEQAEESFADAGVEESNDAPETQTQSFSVSYNQRRDAIRNALDPIITETSETYFWLVDFDDTYAFVERDEWQLADGAFEESHGRFAYAFDEETLSASLTSEFEPMVLQWLTLEENEALEKRRNLLDELLAFRENVMKKSYQDNLEDLLAEFADINDVEEFAEYANEVRGLAEDADTRVDLDVIRDHCFCIRGKQLKTFNKKLEDKKMPRVPLAATATAADDGDPVGRLFEKFSK